MIAVIGRLFCSYGTSVSTFRMMTCIYFPLLVPIQKGAAFRLLPLWLIQLLLGTLQVLQIALRYLVDASIIRNILPFSHDFDVAFHGFFFRRIPLLFEFLSAFWMPNKGFEDAIRGFDSRYIIDCLVNLQPMQPDPLHFFTQIFLAFLPKVW